MTQQKRDDPFGFVQAAAIAARNMPFGLPCTTNQTLFEDTDPRNASATLARWQPVVVPLGIPILGIRDVPLQPARMRVAGMDWVMRLMGDEVSGLREALPLSVYHRLRAAEAQG